MKKLTLLLSAAVAMGITGSALAAQHDTQDLTVLGSVLEVCTLTVANQQAIDLDDDGWQNVAQITGACNSGQQNVNVVYTFTAHNNQSGDGFAYFKRSGPGGGTNDFVGYLSQVLNPNGVRPILHNNYPVPQDNGVPHWLQFKPDQGNHIAGDYDTQLTINVFSS